MFRNLQPQLSEAMEKISQVIKIENDFLFGKGKREAVKNLLQNGAFSIEQTSDLIDVSINLVKEVKTKMDKSY